MPSRLAAALVRRGHDRRLAHVERPCGSAAPDGPRSRRAPRREADRRADFLRTTEKAVQRIGERKSLLVFVIENALHRRPTAIPCNRRLVEHCGVHQSIAATLLVT